MNSIFKLILLPILLLGCESNQRGRNEILKLKSLTCYNNLELCNSITNKIYFDLQKKVVFCFNGNCSICFYKCMQFNSEFKQSLEKWHSNIFHLYFRF